MLKDCQEVLERVDARGVTRRRVRTVNDEPSLTVQSDRESSEIHAVLRRFGGASFLEQLAQADLDFRDVTEFTDLADALRQAKEAEAVFMRQPSKLRELFGHDVANWLDMAKDLAAGDTSKFDAIRPQLEAMGLVDPLVTPPVQPAAAPSPVPESEGS